jgi:hypothetical protein
MAKLYPSAQKSPQIAAWLIKAYLTHRHNGAPILAEDFYKVADNLKYFDALKNNGALRAQGLSGDLLSYKTYQEFLDMLKPFDDKRMAKEAADAFRKLTPAQKEIIKQETTILYDGPEGQVVIPHTPRAAQYWGANTKWCLAGNEAERYFSGYNNKSPIVFIIPKGLQNQKIALVKQTLWNAEDRIIKGLPDAHFHLFQNMLASHPADIAADIKTLIKPDELTIQNLTTKDNKAEPTDNIPPEWQEPLAQLIEDSRSFPKQTSVAPEWLDNKEFMRYAVQKKPYLFEFASPRLKADPDVALAAIFENYAVCLCYAADSLKANRDFMRRAIEIDGRAMEHASNALKADRALALMAIAKTPSAILYLAPSLNRDPHFVLACVKINPDCLNWSILLNSENDAISLKCLEDLIAQGDIYKAKGFSLFRRNQSTWGHVALQFGKGETEKLKTIIAAEKTKLTINGQLTYHHFSLHDKVKKLFSRFQGR